MNHHRLPICGSSSLSTWIKFRILIVSVSASFRDSGIECVFDNRRVVQNCHIVFLACLPCQVQTISEEVRNHISRDCIIYSVVTAVSLPRWCVFLLGEVHFGNNMFLTCGVHRLKQLFHHNNVIKTEFTWPAPSEDTTWPVGCNVTDTLKQEEYAELTCPVSRRAQSGELILCQRILAQHIVGQTECSLLLEFAVSLWRLPRLSWC